MDDGIEWLRRKKVEDERVVAINEQIDVPLDGAYAFHKAIANKYGFAGLIPTPGSGVRKPPAMIGVSVSPTETVQVPLGTVQIPNIDGSRDVRRSEGRPSDLRHRWRGQSALRKGDLRSRSGHPQDREGESIYKQAIKVAFPTSARGLRPHRRTLRSSSTRRTPT